MALLPLVLAAGREFPKSHRETGGWPAQSERGETGGGNHLGRALRKQPCSFSGGLEVKFKYN